MKSEAMRDVGGFSRATRMDLLLVILFSGVIFGYAHFQALSNPFVINDDVRQQIFWMQQWQDPELFKGDVLSDYARNYVTWGVKGVYRVAALGLNPMDFSKVLPGILFVFLAGCLFKIGDVLGKRPLAWMAVAVFWLMPFFLDNLAGGLARAFAAPLLAFFWLCWLREKPWGMGLALLLQALFIPYIFLLAAAAAMLAYLAGRTGRVKLPPFPRRPEHFIFLTAAAALVLFMNHQFTVAGFGPLVSTADMGNRPEFGAYGRYPILPVPSLFWELISPWEFIAPIKEGGLLGGVIGVPLIVGLTLYGAWKVKWRALKPQLAPVVYLGLTSLLLYLVARGLLLKLFFPDRYLIYSLNLGYCLFLALCWNAALRVANWPRSLVVLTLIATVCLSGVRLYNVGLFDFSAARPLCEALAQTPKDTLIAGHPNLMDAVPTFARRRAFATFELAQPWSKGYWQWLKPRLDEFFIAYYATDPETVKAFCRRHHIDFLVVDDRHFTPAFLAGGWFWFPSVQPIILGKPGPPMAEWVWCPFFAPFDEQIRAQVQDRHQPFALVDPEAFRHRHLAAHLWLLDMRPYRTSAPHQERFADPVVGKKVGRCKSNS
jgi:hypothetical protein